MGLFTLRQSDLAYRLDFALHGAAIVALATVIVVEAPRSDRLNELAWCLAGISLWSAIEYALHRFVLHGMEPFRRWHAEHHRHPTALICAPTVLSAGLIVGLVFLPSLALRGLWPASALTLGVMLGYFAYAVTHHAVHQWRPRGAWLRRRKAWHAAHHHDAENMCRFGVTTRFWDRVSGSRRFFPTTPACPPGTQSPEQCAPAHRREPAGIVGSRFFSHLRTRSHDVQGTPPRKQGSQEAEEAGRPEAGGGRPA
jgi:sterol desaturase/sphingolipid hydroxylase (fatty acid hydroxylase superfamily)